MIYCFTGTGNSLQIAEAISSRTGQSVMRITENMLLPDSSEDVWIVSPVYFFNQPPLVRDFVDSLKPAGGRKVVFVFNYGSTPGRVCKKSVRELNKRGFTDVSAFGIRMPENYIMLFSVPPEDKCEKMKDSVDSLVDDIVSKVSETNYVNNKGLGFGSLLTFFGNSAYGMMSKTKKFCVEENCTGCGACAKLHKQPEPFSAGFQRHAAACPPGGGLYRGGEHMDRPNQARRLRQGGKRVGVA